MAEEKGLFREEGASTSVHLTEQCDLSHLFLTTSQALTMIVIAPILLDESIRGANLHGNGRIQVVHATFLQQKVSQLASKEIDMDRKGVGGRDAKVIGGGIDGGGRGQQ